MDCEVLMKYCQGTKCHTYYTQDRLKGSKGSKTNQTRKRTSFGYGGGNFCTLSCQDDWFATHGNNAINHFGRVEKPIILTEETAWKRRYNYHRWHGENTEHLSEYIEVNMVTKEERNCE